MEKNRDKKEQNSAHLKVEVLSMLFLVSTRCSESVLKPANSVLAVTLPSVMVTLLRLCTVQ